MLMASASEAISSAFSRDSPLPNAIPRPSGQTDGHTLHLPTVGIIPRGGRNPLIWLLEHLILRSTPMAASRRMGNTGGTGATLRDAVLRTAPQGEVNSGLPRQHESREPGQAVDRKKRKLGGAGRGQ